MVSKITSENTCAVVIWFNPTQQQSDNINLYGTHVKRVFIVDNSDNDNSHLLQNSVLTNIEYLPQKQNLGIATALNIGCKAAISHGAEWILTMDQDSKFNLTPFTDYIDEANQYLSENPNAEIGLLAPLADCYSGKGKHHKRGKFEERTTVMASGNLLPAACFQLTNGFRDDFFIDLVDNEICCHLRRLGKKIIRLNDISLNHQLGEGPKKIFLGKKYITHTPWRYFYIGRNLNRIIQLYPEYASYFNRQKRTYIKRLLLYEWEQKCAKIQEFRRGWKAGRNYLSKRK